VIRNVSMRIRRLLTETVESGVLSKGKVDGKLCGSISEERVAVRRGAESHLFNYATS